jgi:hypothetical protein
VEQQLRERLLELKDQFDKGQRKLTELDAQTAELRQTLLRISGAIQVLEEELVKAGSPERMEAANGRR